jgi:hypothetical protein
MNNYPHYGMIQGPFAKEVLGKTFTIIQGKDIKKWETFSLTFNA